MAHTPEQAAKYGTAGKGKKTQAGKMRSSRNALKHGLRSGQPPLLLSEDLTQFNGTMTSLVEQYQPQGAAEMHLVEILAMAIWKQHRLWGAEAAMLNSQTMKATQQAAFPALVKKGVCLPSEFSDQVIPHSEALSTERSAIESIIKDLKYDLSVAPHSDEELNQPLNDEGKTWFDWLTNSLGLSLPSGSYRREGAFWQAVDQFSNQLYCYNPCCHEDSEIQQPIPPVAELTAQVAELIELGESRLSEIEFSFAELGKYQRRVQELDSQSSILPETQFNLLGRYQASARAEFYRALEKLNELQSQRDAVV